MKNKVNFLSALIGVFIIAILFTFVYFLAVAISKYISQISPNIAVAIIGGLVSVFGYFLARNFERKKIIEQQIREKKLPVYEQFTDFLFNVIMGSKTENPISKKEMESFMIEFNKKSIVWLSDNSLKAYIKWKVNLTSFKDNSNSEVLQSLYDLEDLLLEFRKDIGHNNKDLKKGDLLSLFINDLEQLQA